MKDIDDLNPAERQSIHQSLKLLSIYFFVELPFTKLKEVKLKRRDKNQ
jgi:hypothetical protein